MHSYQPKDSMHQVSSPLKEFNLNSSVQLQPSSNQHQYSFNQDKNHRLKRMLTNQQSLKCQQLYRSIRIKQKQNVEPQAIYQAKLQMKNNTSQRKTNVLKFHYQNSQAVQPKNVISRPVEIKPFLIDNIYQSITFGNSLPQPQKEIPKLSVSEPQKSMPKLSVSDFQKVKQLGKGKFGTVWLVRHKASNVICAMKIVKKSVVRQQKVEYQIAKEIRIHNTLKHLNIIAFYGFFDDVQHMYILTEYATGGQVYSLLKKDFRLKENLVSNIIKQTADGLHFMHNLGYIHRDIKPENLIIQFNTIKICDFGWTAQCSQREMRKSICGTPLYYSPELVKQADHNSAIDVWSLGILAYQLLIGRVPFKIFSQFDLPVIIQQEVTFPDYIDLQEPTKSFILTCLTKNNFLRPSISSLKYQPFIKKKHVDIQSTLFSEFQKIF